MNSLAALFMATLIFGSVGLSQDKPSASERAPLLLVQEIPLLNVGGRIDHFTFDAKRKRVIGAALGNNTVEIVDTFSAASRTVRRIPAVTVLGADVSIVAYHHDSPMKPTRLEISIDSLELGRTG